MVEYYHRLIEYIQQVGSIVLLLSLVLHGDVLEIANGIERGVAEESDVGSIVTRHVDVVNQRVDGFCRAIVGMELLADCLAVWEGHRGMAVGNSHTGCGVDADERTRVALVVIVAALHQCTLGIEVAQSHIYSYRRIEVGQYGAAGGGVVKSFHILLLGFCCSDRFLHLCHRVR